MHDINYSRDFLTELNDHMIDCAIGDNHILELIYVYTIVRCYCEIRLHHVAKEKTQPEARVRVRKKLSKLLLFKNQLMPRYAPGKCAVVYCPSLPG